MQFKDKLQIKIALCTMIGAIHVGVMLDSWISDGDVYAALTTYQLLASKQFNRAVRSLTVTHEAFTALKLSAFVARCDPVEGEPMICEALADPLQAYKYEDPTSCKNVVIPQHST